MNDRVTLQEQVACVRREIGLRKRVYPRRVKEGQMTQAFANEQIRVMEAVLETLEKIEADDRLL